MKSASIALSITLVLGWTASSALAQTCFVYEPDVPVGDGPNGVAFADLDGDGDLDMGTPAGAHQVSLHWNQGDGTWSVPTLIDTVAYPTCLSFSDVDGDGDQDLLYATNLNTLHVRRNLGAQTFGAVEPYSVTLEPQEVECADLDNDGDQDIVLAGGSSGVSMTLRNDGTGTFTPGTTLLTGARRIALGDFDADGDVDVALLSTYEAFVYLERNDGQGLFPGDPTPIQLGSIAFDLAAGDLDGDGTADLAIAQLQDRISILFGVPGGSFAPHVEVPMPHDSHRVRLADIDGDGDLDLALLDWVTRVVELCANAGNGTFTIVGAIATFAVAYEFGDADIDADGDADVAIVMGGLDLVRVRRSCAVIGQPMCFGDGSATACPCGNASPVGARAGCTHSLGSAGTLRASGWTYLAYDTVVLHGASMPNAAALYFQGTSAVNGGLGNVFGDGLSCAGGTIVRLGTTTNVGGASQYPAPGQPSVSARGGITTPGERHYQVWYRNAASYCTGATFNLTNSLRLDWRP